jgi:hypothetical protein
MRTPIKSTVIELQEFERSETDECRPTCSYIKRPHFVELYMRSSCTTINSALDEALKGGGGFKKTPFGRQLISEGGETYPEALLGWPRVVPKRRFGSFLLHHKVIVAAILGGIHVVHSPEADQKPTGVELVSGRVRLR